LFPETGSAYQQIFSCKEIVNRWSSQYFEPADGLPYIGLCRASGTIYVLQVWWNGMVYSAVAAITLCEMITGGK
jgi:hypothetical protein